MLYEILILVVALILVVVFVVLVSTLVITPSNDYKPSSSTPRTSSSPTASTDTKPPPPPTFWSENIRGNPNFESFPPCFQKDPHSKNIYSIIARANLVQRYYTLLDTLSLLICLKEEQSRECKSIQIKDRLTQVLGMGGNPNDEDSKLKAMSFFPVNDNMISKLLVGSIYLTERQLKIIKDDPSLYKTDKEQLTGHLYTFYTTNIPTIYKLCLDSKT